MATPTYQRILEQADELTLAELQRVIAHLQRKIEDIQRAETEQADKPGSVTFEQLGGWTAKHAQSLDEDERKYGTFADLAESAKEIDDSSTLPPPVDELSLAEFQQKIEDIKRDETWETLTPLAKFARLAEVANVTAGDVPYTDVDDYLEEHFAEDYMKRRNVE